MTKVWKRIVTIILIVYVYISQSTILDSSIFGIKESSGASVVSAVGVQGITDRKGQIFPVTGNYYVYAPSVIKEGNIYHVFYCSNAQEGKIKDSMHVCDPSVTMGDFVYRNNSYKYLMAYLGCSSRDNQDNKIGFALSNNCENWVKVENQCIAEDFDAQSDAFQWGVGQPSVLMMDGRLLVFLYKWFCRAYL